MWADITFWHWLVAGVALIILEMFAPSTIFVWLGIAASAVGVTLIAWPDMSWELQAILFAALSVVSLVAGRRWASQRPEPANDTHLNRRGHNYIGKTYTLEQPIERGSGRIHLGDTWWRIEGPDLPAGQKVKITGINGSSLQVEAVE